jgi:hypothetical protein
MALCRASAATAGDAGDWLSEKPLVGLRELYGVRQGVTETGFVEGHSVKYEYRYANGDYNL